MQRMRVRGCFNIGQTAVCIEERGIIVVVTGAIITGRCHRSKSSGNLKRCVVSRVIGKINER